MDLVRGLLSDQHPDLADLTLRLLADGPDASGWDNVGVRCGDDLLVRLPRRALAAALVAGEQRALRELGPDLALPVPVPLRTGDPGRGYPWSWSVVPWFDGTAAATVPPPTGPRAVDAARRLGRFLATLHRPAPADVPGNPHRGVPLAARSEDVADRLDRVSRREALDVEALRAVLAQALAAPPWPGPPVWVHGDLHPGNVLVAGGQVVAVLDFGDVHAGDPALDAMIAWLLLPVEVHGVLRHVAPSLDEHTWRRGAGWALLLALVLLETAAADVGPWARHGGFASAGRRALAALVTEHCAGLLGP